VKSSWVKNEESVRSGESAGGGGLGAGNNVHDALYLTVCADDIVADGSVDGPVVVGDDEGEETLGDNVKHGVADGFGVAADRSSAFGKDPNNGVEEPTDNREGQTVGSVANTLAKPDGESGIGSGTAGDGASERGGCVADDVLSSERVESYDVGGAGGEHFLGPLESSELGAESPNDGDEGKHTEAPEDPLLAAADEGTDETGDDHDEVHEEDHVPVESGKVQSARDLPKHKGGGEEPVNVPGVVERATVAAAGDVAVATGHGEVSHGGDKEDGGSNDFLEGEDVVLQNKCGKHRCGGAVGAKGQGINTESLVGKDFPERANEPESGEEQHDESYPERPAAGETKAGGVCGAFRAGIARWGGVRNLGCSVRLGGGSVGLGLGGGSGSFVTVAVVRLAKTAVFTLCLCTVRFLGARVGGAGTGFSVQARCFVFAAAKAGFVMLDVSGGLFSVRCSAVGGLGLV